MMKLITTQGNIFDQAGEGVGWKEIYICPQFSHLLAGQGLLEEPNIFSSLVQGVMVDGVAIFALNFLIFRVE